MAGVKKKRRVVGEIYTRRMRLVKQGLSPVQIAEVEGLRDFRSVLDWARRNKVKFKQARDRDIRREGNVAKLRELAKEGFTIQEAAKAVGLHKAWVRRLDERYEIGLKRARPDYAKELSEAQYEEYRWLVHVKKIPAAEAVEHARKVKPPKAA